jgi:hypothetical protein
MVQRFGVTGVSLLAVEAGGIWPDGQGGTRPDGGAARAARLAPATPAHRRPPPSWSVRQLASHLDTTQPAIRNAIEDSHVRQLPAASNSPVNGSTPPTSAPIGLQNAGVGCDLRVRARCCPAGEEDRGLWWSPWCTSCFVVRWS